MLNMKRPPSAFNTWFLGLILLFLVCQIAAYTFIIFFGDQQ